MESNSIELAVQAGTDLFKLIDASIKVSYNHEWSTEHDFKQKITVHIPPHNQCAVLGTAPMLRDTGDFTVKMGNSTWTLAGVYFDTPDPNRAADWGYTIVCKKLTASQLATLPHGVSSTPVVRGPYTVGAGATHGSIARTRLRLQLSGAARLIPGQLVRYRVLLGRRNPADRLVYSPQNVRVRLRHGTRTVGDAVISTLRVGHPRTLQVTVIVPRSAQDRFCVTATVTARRAIGTQARACGTVDTSLRGLG